MALILGKMKESYDYVFYDLADYRTKHLFPSPLVLFTMLPFYVYFSKSLGPRLMKDVKPFKLKKVILFYNIFQIVISAYIFFEGLSAGWLSEYSWTCQPVEMADNPTTRRMINGHWWYTLVKIIDLMDTVFFVLRKKDRQISFLHLFHHTMMPVASFVGFKYFPNGHASLLGIINCLVHVVMYTYYLISGLGPQYQKYLWWKKHVTILQLVQFGIILIHNVTGYYVNCGFPRWIHVILIIHSTQFLYMFGNFYYVNYIKTAKKDPKNGSVETVTDKIKVN